MICSLIVTMELHSLLLMAKANDFANQLINPCREPKEMIPQKIFNIKKSVKCCFWECLGGA